MPAERDAIMEVMENEARCTSTVDPGSLNTTGVVEDHIKICFESFADTPGHSNSVVICLATLRIRLRPMPYGRAGRLMNG